MNDMNVMIIKCPHCEKPFLGMAEDGETECPSCKKPIKITIIPSQVRIEKVE